MEHWARSEALAL